MRLFSLKAGSWLLLLPVTAGAWLITSWLNYCILNQARNPGVKLHADVRPHVELILSPKISSIEARRDRDDDITEVTINISDSSLKQLKFKYPIDDFSQIETLLTQEFGLQTMTVQQLIQYRTENDELQAK